LMLLMLPVACDDSHETTVVAALGCQLAALAVWSGSFLLC